MSLEQLEQGLPHSIVRCCSVMMEPRADFEEVSSIKFYVPTVAECAAGQFHFFNSSSVEVGVDWVGSRHHSHPTSDCGIVTLPSRYGLPYDTCF